MTVETGEVHNKAQSRLARHEHKVKAKVKTRELSPGNAYTVWLVIFNTPEGCQTSPCGEADIGYGPATSSVIWSGASGVARPNGKLKTKGVLRVGNPAGYQQLLADLGAPDPGFLDADDAEIHFVIRDHGPVTGNPDQLTTFEGDCTAASSFGLGAGTYECVDVQFSIHEADD